MGKFAGLYEYIRAEHADSLREMAPAAREAAIFVMSLREMPFEWREEDRFAGWFGFDAPPVFTPAESFSPPRFADEAEWREYEHFTSSYIICPNVDRAHTCVDYETILTRGLSWYAARVEKALAETPDDPILTAMKTALEGAHAFSLRLAAELEGKNDPRAARAAAALRRVPWEPARDLVEALQSVWLIHFMLPLAENAWYSISLGRFDQYMYPYFEAARAGMEESEIRACFREFFLLLNNYADFACALNLGGADAEGRDMYNDLSFYLLDLEKEWKFPGPIFTTRVSADTSDETMEKLVDPVLFSIGQPTFYGEENCCRVMINRGVPEDEAVGFACNSCMGLAMPGQECNDMWGCVFNTALTVELAVNGGKTVTGEQVIDPALLPAVTDRDSLLAAVTVCAAKLLDRGLAYYEQYADYIEQNLPDPFLSAITDDCIVRRRDRLGGARYRNATVETFGLVDAADALVAIDTLVFREGRYTLADFVSAVADDFADPDFYAAVRACPRYGMGDTYADGIAADLAERICALVAGHSHDGRLFLPSLHTLDTNVAWGHNWRASCNGRRAGEPFAKNAGPENAVRKKECTSVVLSAGCLPQTLLTGGQPIDLHFVAKDVESPDGRRKIAALIRTYFKLNGLQLQVNSLSVEQLEEAYAHPEAHGDLIVRIGGFSTYFNWLTDGTKREFIDRFKREEA